MIQAIDSRVASKNGAQNDFCNGALDDSACTPTHPDASLYGGKGASLMIMASMDIPVPPGFIIPIDGHRHFLQESRQSKAHPESGSNILPESIELALQALEKKTGQRLGDVENPLFLSVRSGGAASMPGMLDTFLNIGLTPDTCPALAHRLGWSVAKALGFYYENQKIWTNQRHSESTSGVKFKPDPELGKSQNRTREPRDDLWQAIQAVWNSWDSPRAVAYRHHHHMSMDGGSAVIIQSMVFGNASGNSGTGVLFTRRPDTGENELFGEFLHQAQGESLVSGSVTPLPLCKLQTFAPKIFAQLHAYAKQLEVAQGDMQDIEFTFEGDRLWILQTRSGKRTARATFRIAHDRVMEGESTRQNVLLKIDPRTVDALLYPHLVHGHDLPLIARGLPTSAGAAIGQLTVDMNQVTEDSILLRNETSAEDVPAMLIARGVIALRGGLTSHAAVIMRSIGKPCISGLENAEISPQGLHIGGQLFPTGTMVTIDGENGDVFQGQGTVETPSFSPETNTVLSWADAERQLGVWANADTPKDVERALEWGADGIGLCRSEHMMFEPTHLRLMHQFILAPRSDWRQNALQDLEILHCKDLLALIHASKGRRLVVRLLDPPVHEFLPVSLEEKTLLTNHWGISLPEVESCIAQRREINPMMGQRGCRLGLAFPDLYAMQMRALFHAMDAAMQQGCKPDCGILIPLIADKQELETLRDLYWSLEPGSRNVNFGAMIETPRAALLADTLAPLVDFISFGTNDLTQMTWGLSRDDCLPITQTYEKLGLSDPFSQLDIAGVGQLISLACARAKQANPKVTISVCGEHAACPESIPFFQDIGIDSLSCSPWALPRVRLAAAKACLDVV
jgi:pyruvate,orthophosphate dikinase